MIPDARSSLVQRLNEFKRRLDIAAVIFAPYILVLVWQYFAVLNNKVLAWTLAVIVSGLIWGVYVSIRETASEELSRSFWLVVALPLVLIYSLRVAFPDISFDVLNYHIFNSERALRGPLLIQGDFFPIVVPFNPAPDLLTGLYRYLLGYRLGTVVNLLTLIWTGAIVNRFLREYFRSSWLRNLAVLLVLLTEQILFQINNYMVDLLALPLLLEATALAIEARHRGLQTKQTLRLAFLLGVATAFKLTNLFFAVPIVLVYLINLTAQGTIRDRLGLFGRLLKSTPIAAILFVAPSAPFTILIYRLTGNPIFPLYNRIFKSPYWPQGAVLDPRWGPWGIGETVIWPVMMLFKPQRLSEFLHYSGRLSIGYLVAVVCFVIARGDRKIRTIAFITVVGTLLWSASSGYIRYALYLEITSGILLIWTARYLWQKSAEFPSWSKLLAQTPLALLLIVQSCVALRYVSHWEWSTRPTIVEYSGPFLREAENSLGDRSLRSYISSEDLAMLDGVEVWVETTYKTSAFSALLNPHIPGIGVRMPNYFVSNEARQKFSDTLQSLQGKRMFTLTTAESMGEARSLLSVHGLSMLKPRPVSIYYFSGSLKFDVFLAEVVTSWQNGSANSRAEKGMPLPDIAFKAQLSAAKIPTVMRAGQKYSIRVSLRNDSRIVWPGLQPTWQFQLTVGDSWRTQAGAIVNNMDGRVALFEDLAPSETIELPLSITAPNNPGDYILQLDVIQEGVAWFGERGSEVFSLPVKVQ